MENLLRILRRNIPAVFLEDLNAKHNTVGHSTTNTAGRNIKHLINTGIAKYIPTDFDTRISPIGRGRPDIILTNQQNFLNTAISAGPQTTSDHIPIILQLATTPIMHPKISRFNFHKGELEKFRELNNNEEININNAMVDTIDREVDNWFATVTQAMESNIAKSEYRTIPYPKLTTEIKNLQ